MHRLRAAALIALALGAGCRDRPLPAPAPRAPPAVDARVVLPDDVDCLVDRDCALLPYVTCCGECAPSPPFEIGTREALDALFIEAEERCARDRRDCTRPVCDPMPRGCYARAACVGGKCVVESEGC